MRSVEKMPVSMKRAKICRRWLIHAFLPPRSLSWNAMIWAAIVSEAAKGVDLPMMAPNLPEAAEIPCEVER